MFYSCCWSQKPNPSGVEHCHSQSSSISFHILHSRFYFSLLPHSSSPAHTLSPLLSVFFRVGNLSGAQSKLFPRHLQPPPRCRLGFGHKTAPISPSAPGQQEHCPRECLSMMFSHNYVPINELDPNLSFFSVFLFIFWLYLLGIWAAPALLQAFLLQ